MIFEKFKALTIDRTIKAMIGMTRKQFDALASVFESAHQSIQAERLQRREIKRLPAGGSQGVLDSDEKRLFFLLYYLKTYPTFDVLGFHFDLSAGHAHDYICQFMPILQRALEQLDVAPKRSFDTVDDFKQVIEKYNEIFVDGVEVPCVRPQDHEVQAEYYSGKKKRHTVKALVMTDQHRYIIYVSRLFGGHAHDYHLFKTEFDPQYPWFSEVETFVDLGALIIHWSKTNDFS